MPGPQAVRLPPPVEFSPFDLSGKGSLDNERIVMEQARAKFSEDGDKALANLLTLRMQAYDLLDNKPPKDLQQEDSPAKRPAHLRSLEEQKEQAALEEDFEFAEKLKQVLATLDEAEASRMRSHAATLADLMKKRDDAKAHKKWDRVIQYQEEIAKENSRKLDPPEMNEAHKLAAQIADLEQDKRDAKVAEDFERCSKLNGQITLARQALRRHLMAPTTLAVLQKATDAADEEDDAQGETTALVPHSGDADKSQLALYLPGVGVSVEPQTIRAAMSSRLVALGAGLLALVFIALMATSLNTGGPRHGNQPAPLEQPKGWGKLPDTDSKGTDLAATAASAMALRGAPLHDHHPEIVITQFMEKDCPHGSTRIRQPEVCAQFAQTLGLAYGGTIKGVGSRTGPLGCMQRSSRVWFNTGVEGVKKLDARAICKATPQAQPAPAAEAAPEAEAEPEEAAPEEAAPEEEELAGHHAP